MVAGAAEVTVLGCSLLVTVSRADPAVHVENDLCRRVTGMNPIDPYLVHVGQGFNVRVGGQKLRLEASHLAGGRSLSCDNLAADDPPHDRIGAEPVGIVHVVVATKTAKEGLAELPNKTVASFLPMTGVGEHVPGHVGQPESIIQFPLRQQPGVGSDRGSVELKLQPTVEIKTQSPASRFTRLGHHINNPNTSITQ